MGEADRAMNVSEVVGTIPGLFPAWNGASDPEVMAMWTMALSDCDPRKLAAAVLSLARESDWPSIHGLRARVAAQDPTRPPSPAEAWGRVLEALAKRQGMVDLGDPSANRALETLGGLEAVRWVYIRRTDGSGDWDRLRHRFIAAFEDMATSAGMDRSIGEASALVEGLARRLSLNGRDPAMLEEPEGQS